MGINNAIASSTRTVVSRLDSYFSSKLARPARQVKKSSVTGPSLVATHLTTHQGDTERNVFATQVSGVVRTAVHQHNAVHGGDVKAGGSHDGCAHVHHDPDGFDYDAVFMKAMPAFRARVKQYGIDIPASVRQLSFAEQEHLKRMKSGMENLKAADHDPDLSPGWKNPLKMFKARRDFSRRVANEKQLALDGKLMRHVASVLESKVHEWMLKLDAASLVDADAAEQESMLRSQAFLDSLSMQDRLSAEALRLALDLKDSRDGLRLSAKASSETVSIQSGSCFLKPLGFDEAAKTHTANPSGQTLRNAHERGFELHQPYGQFRGEPCCYRLQAKPSKDGVSMHWHFAILSADGATELYTESISPTPESVKKLGAYFSRFDLNLLFGDGSAVADCTYESLVAHLGVEAELKKCVESLVYRDIDNAIRAEVKARNLGSIQGTGFSYNAALYGENLAVSTRAVMTGRLFEMAKRGEIALHGSCGFQQNLIWHQGGNIIAVQDTTGETFLPSPHGNDPFTVDEKQTCEAAKRYTARAGLYEKPLKEAATSASAWKKRNHEAITVPCALVEQESIRNMLVKHKGNPVAGLQGFGLKDARFLRITGRKPTINTLAAIQHLSGLPESDDFIVTLECPVDGSLRDSDGEVVTQVDESGQHLPVDVRSRLTLRFAPVRKCFELVGLEHWAAVPMPDPSDKTRVAVDAQGQVKITYQKVQQGYDADTLAQRALDDSKFNLQALAVDALDPDVLIDPVFQTINCVHTQNGLASVHENLGPQVAITGRSVLPRDAAHGRPSIMAGNRFNPRSHVVAVPANSPQQSLIAEAIDLGLGAGTVATLNQHHSDMIQFEGGVDENGKPRRLNPYLVGDIREELPAHVQGNRFGNSEVLTTAIALRAHQAAFEQIRGFDSENREHWQRAVTFTSSYIESLQTPGGTSDAGSRQSPPKLSPQTSITQESGDKCVIANPPSNLPEPGTTPSPSPSPLLVNPAASPSSNSAGTTDSLDTQADAELKVRLIEQLPALLQAEMARCKVSRYSALAFPARTEVWVNCRTGLATAGLSISNKVWNDITRSFDTILSEPGLEKLLQISNQLIARQAELDAKCDYLEDLNQQIKDAVASGDFTALDNASRQLRFRQYPDSGWAIAPGPKAGMALNALPHALYGLLEPLGPAAALGTQIATVGDSILPFGILLAAAGIESFKNADYARRRLTRMKNAYQDQIKATESALQSLEATIRDDIERIQKAGFNEPAQIYSEAAKVLSARARVMDERRKLLQQDFNQQIVSQAIAPALTTAAAATTVGSALKLGGLATAGSAAGIAGAGALLGYGLVQTGSSIRALWKTRKINREMAAKDLCVDSGLRRAFNIYYKQRVAAQKFKIANWGLFSLGSALMLGGSVASASGAGAAVGIPISATGAALVAGSVVTAVIDPVREWRGKTTMAAEDTLHLQGDFLSTARRRNRLVNNLNGQMGVVATLTGKMLDHGLTSNDSDWKNFSHRFNRNKTLRWFMQDWHRRSLARVVEKRTDDIKDYQIDLMYRTNRHEINFMAFRVAERKAEVDAVGKALVLAQSGTVAALQMQYSELRMQYEKDRQRLDDLQRLQQELDLYATEMDRAFRSNGVTDDTRSQFDRLRLRYLLTHDLLVDGLRRSELRQLLQMQTGEAQTGDESARSAQASRSVISARSGRTQDVAVMQAVVDGKVYRGQAGERVPARGKIQTVSMNTTDQSIDWFMQHLPKVKSTLGVDKVFARVMCSSLPQRIGYELNATMNVHMEDLRQRAYREEMEKASHGFTV